MSAGILEHDRGAVMGTTWHGIESYVEQEGPVTREQARDILDFPMVKKRLRCNITFEDFSTKPVVVDAWAIVRTDINVPIVPAVGKRFDVQSNIVMYDWIEENMLNRFEDVEMESVGTLFNGATTFINLKVGEMQIKGDKSPIVNRVMWFNPLGKGSYGACAHGIRVVCNNTLTAAVAQGALNETLQRFRHTISATEKMEKHFEDIAEIQLGMDAHEVDLNALAQIAMSAKEVDEFLTKIFGVKIEKATDRQNTIATNKINGVMEQFESDQDLDPDTAHSRYGLLQAITYMLDHGTIKNGDIASLAFDGIIGQRSKLKEKIFRKLLNLDSEQS